MFFALVEEMADRQRWCIPGAKVEIENEKVDFVVRADPFGDLVFPAVAPASST